MDRDTRTALIFVAAYPTANALAGWLLLTLFS